MKSLLVGCVVLVSSMSYAAEKEDFALVAARQAGVARGGITNDQCAELGDLVANALNTTFGYLKSNPKSKEARRYLWDVSRVVYDLNAGKIDSKEDLVERIAAIEPFGGA